MMTDNMQGYGLSPLQQRLWELQAQSDAYRTEAEISVDGLLNQEALRSAMQVVVERHEILRTGFHQVSGLTLPVQVINESGPVFCEEADLSAWSGEEQEKAQTAFREKWSASRPPLTEPSLIRFALVKLAADKHVLLVGMPTLCGDGQTVRNLVRELELAYRQETTGTAVFEEEAVAYIQYSEWANELLQSEEAESGVRYWQGRDLSSLAFMRLPFERQEYSRISAWKRESVALTPQQAAGLQAAAHAQGVPLTTFLLAAWQLLLSRYLGQEELVMGYVADGRTFEELEDACGLYARTLPLTAVLDSESTFADLLRQAAATVEQALEWQDFSTAAEHPMLPFSFECLDVRADQPAREPRFSVKGVSSCTEPFVLKLAAVLREDGAALELQYDSERLPSEMVRDLGASLSAILEQAADGSPSPIQQWTFAVPARQTELIERWKRSESTPTTEPSVGIHHLMEKAAAAHPERTALRYEEHVLTYAELNQRANRIARLLQGMGIRPGQVVGICMERSPEMIVWLLGILKAGSAYLPLDPDNPQERLSYLLADSKAAALLTCESLRHRMPSGSWQTICPDRETETLAALSADNLTLPMQPDHIAYLIYTSGTTGQPKGVMVEHRNLLHYCRGILSFLEVEEGASFATVSTLAADLGNTAIYPALCTGGELHVIAKERLLNPEALAEYMHAHPVDCLKIVPSHLSALLACSDPERILPRKRLILGGEPLYGGLVQRVRELAPDCTVINHYGPTETTVGVLAYRLEPGDCGAASSLPTVPVGRPLDGTEVFVLDEQLRPVPYGIAGELYVGGNGVTRGYLNRPELTEEKYVSHPFRENSSGRLYRTGDRVRHWPDGMIEYVGRMDDQIKLRGYRIEIREIEHTLLRHEDVREAVVVVRENEAGEQSLAAYLTAERQTPELVTEIKRFLQHELPDYMVPGVLMLLDALPLTANGKVNRRALPDPSREQTVHPEYLAPRNMLELELAQLWEQLLGKGPVSIRDNFFERGGHSMLMMRLLSAIQKKYGKTLTMSDVFQHPTVEGQAFLLHSDQAGPKGKGDPLLLIPLQPSGARRPLFCVHPGSGHVFSYLELSRHLGADQPLYGLQAVGLEEGHEPLDKVERMASRYIEAMQQVDATGPYRILGWSFGGVVAAEMAKQLRRRGYKVECLLLVDSRAPLPLYKNDEDVAEEAMSRAFSQEQSQVLAAQELDQVQLQRYYRVYRANRIAMHQYEATPSAYADKTILLLAEEGGARFDANAAVGWDRVILGELDVCLLPGDHFTLLQSPHVRMLAERIKIHMDEASY